MRWPPAACTAQINADKARDALFDHRHAKQAVHAAHGHGVVGDDQVAGVGFARHRVEQVAEAFDIGIVERRIDFVEHTDRRRVGQEQSEDQRDCGQRLFAARQQGQRLQLLARRLGENLEACFQRIVAVDQC